MSKNIWFDDLRAQQQALFETLNIKSSSVIENQINVAIDAGEHGNTLAAILNLNRIGLLRRDLSILETSNNHAYRALRRDLRNAKDQDGHFHGTRFELSVAAQLCLRGIGFTKQERPDFRVGELGIECTSCRKAGGKADAETKFLEAIAKKNAKPYGEKSSILKIDVTNLFFHDDLKEWQSLLDQLTNLARAEVEKTKYGAIGIYLFRQSQIRTYEIGYGFNIVIAKNAHTDVVAFLNQHYPNVGVTIPGPAIPKES
ncbi:MAG: hypothetical protein AAF720_15550 [Pseudomonadota bacterium]